LALESRGAGEAGFDERLAPAARPDQEIGGRAYVVQPELRLQMRAVADGINRALERVPDTARPIRPASPASFPNSHPLYCEIIPQSVKRAKRLAAVSAASNQSRARAGAGHRTAH